MSVPNARRVSAGAQRLLNTRECTLTDPDRDHGLILFEGTLLLAIRELPQDRATFTTVTI